jgi:hypothetical protein
LSVIFSAEKCHSKISRLSELYFDSLLGVLVAICVALALLGLF